MTVSSLGRSLSSSSTESEACLSEELNSFLKEISGELENKVFLSPDYLCRCENLFMRCLDLIDVEDSTSNSDDSFFNNLIISFNLYENRQDCIDHVRNLKQSLVSKIREKMETNGFLPDHYKKYYQNFLNKIDRVDFFSNLLIEREVSLFNRFLHEFHLYPKVLCGEGEVQKADVSIAEQQDSRGRNLFHWACMHDESGEALTTLLSPKHNIADYQQMIHQQDEDGNTPLHLACAVKNIYAIQMLSEYKPNLGSQNQKKQTLLFLLLEDWRHLTSFHSGDQIAVKNNCQEDSSQVHASFLHNFEESLIQTMRILVCWNIDVLEQLSADLLEKLSEDQSTPLIDRLRERGIDLLNKRGMDLLKKWDVVVSGELSEGQLEEWGVELLMEQGLSVLKKLSEDLLKERDVAVLNKQGMDLLKKLSEDLSQVDVKGRNLLHAAVKHHLPDCVAYLLKAGVDPNQSDEDGNTPLFEMIQPKEERSVSTTIDDSQYPVKEFIQWVYRGMDTPERVNAMCSIIEHFKQAGVDLSHKNKANESVYDKARRCGEPLNVVRLLQQDESVPMDM